MGAEMWTRSPIMQGNTEQHQLTLIGHFCGAMNEEVWPGVSKLGLFGKLDMPKESKRRAKKRLDADSALNHDFMWSDPMPCSLEGMLATHIPPRRRATRGGMVGGSLRNSAQNQNQHHQQLNRTTSDGFIDRVF